MTLTTPAPHRHAAPRWITVARIAGLGIHLPDDRRTTEETEARLAAENPGLRLPSGLIARLTGVRGVHVRHDGWQTSDLAVAAARRALAQSPGPVDLLVFASASQDLIEPATAHIVAAKLGVAAPVMDVKNACNSLLAGMQVAEALIATGQARRALVVSGEQPSHAVRWRLESSAQFLRSFPGYTMSDGGAAVLLEASDDPGVGIIGSRFAAHSEHWRIGTLPTGGSLNPHAQGGSYFDMDGRALERAFARVGLGIFGDTLAALGVHRDELDFVAVHQVALPMHRRIVDLLGVDPAITEETVSSHGNLASVSLPLQLHRAVEQGRVGPGSLVALVGLAGGISLGVTVLRW
ncbi:3-oxoacyl-ACP synthase III family protein [Agromyces aurantiacus]|uniref:3-oxoacyl-ACP synthase III family protein n=1 Tax=Agromyces aurantiacus TaxID=165814 RepID=A0ABV9R1G7_9MICO|nr:3-oxoacyl-[acyl-carrier-protein] synthase III C-terminal domain-containing protein [Agromyces aurantiacus]MBM7505629.1 3-oxoacyl-[acyl-carrier-protein] synthase-3 [Agromyces aurantiacus]